MQYKDFEVTNNHSLNVFNAIKYCIENNCEELEFEKGEYHFYKEYADEDVLCVSNNDMYGFTRIAFKIKNCENLTINGNGSTFVFHGSIVTFAIINSKDITIKNLTIDYDDAMTVAAKIIDVNEEYFDFEVINNGKYCVSDGMLYFYNDVGDKDIYHYMTIRSYGEDLSFIAESKDTFRVFNSKIRFEDLGNRKIRVFNASITPKVGMRIITRGTVRFASNIFSEMSKNVNILNVTMYKSYSMGVIAQKTENVTIDNMLVKAKEGELFSLNCDATHFVHCKGLIKVINSSFSEQQDDALNIHGIYTQIVDKKENYIIIKYMHHQAKGINIYEKGSVVSVLNPKSLISKALFEIKKAEVININYTKLYLKGDLSKIKVGDVVEDLTWSCDLVFENNKVFNNRARGMLVAAKGKVIIKNNYFNTPGVAVLFESDGEKWFESGGTTDVLIENNHFYNCRYTNGNWGSNVIEVKPRSEIEKDKYYHESITIKNNVFENCSGSLLYADNILNLNFTDNKLINSENKTTIVNCKNIL